MLASGTDPVSWALAVVGLFVDPGWAVAAIWVESAATIDSDAGAAFGAARLGGGGAMRTHAAPTPDPTMIAAHSARIHVFAEAPPVRRDASVMLAIRVTPVLSAVSGGVLAERRPFDGARCRPDDPCDGDVGCGDEP